MVMALAASAEAKPKHADRASIQHLGDAFRAYDRGDLAQAKHLLEMTSDVTNRDYALWLTGMVALRTGDAPAAKKAFDKLGKQAGSRFAPQVAWRLADTAWLAGDRATAIQKYEALLGVANAEDAGDLGTAMYRIAEVMQTADAYRALVIAHPSHPLAAVAEAKMLALGGAPLTPEDRVARAKQLTTAHLWDQAIAELALVPKTGIAPPTANQRDYWMGTTLYEMRRRYGDAGELLLAVYPKLGDTAAEAMFHGARALSRADRDDDAIAWYHKVVAQFPATAYAQEAQFLSGWLEFNRGHYKAAIQPLEESLAKYPRSKWVDDSLWFLGMSHYFLGEWDQARTRLVALSKLRGSLEAGKGSYWLARIDERLKNDAAASAGYRATVTKFPFSWYALLSHSRLAALGTKLGPFGDGEGKARGPKLSATVDESLASDDLIARADELIAAGLGVDAGLELARSEKAFLGRHDKAAAFAMLLDRYQKAGNFNRPWMLAVSYSGSALDGAARRRCEAMVGERVSARVSRARREIPSARHEPRRLSLFDHAQREWVRSARPVVRGRAGLITNDPTDNPAGREDARPSVRRGQALRARLQRAHRQLVHRPLAREVQDADSDRRRFVQ